MQVRQRAAVQRRRRLAQRDRPLRGGAARALGPLPRLTPVTAERARERASERPPGTTCTVLTTAMVGDMIRGGGGGGSEWVCNIQNNLILFHGRYYRFVIGASSTKWAATKSLCLSVRPVGWPAGWPAVSCQLLLPWALSPRRRAAVGGVAPGSVLSLPSSSCRLWLRVQSVWCAPPWRLCVVNGPAVPGV
jgi:hypothetical protein